jgi:phosphate/sulfate permease
MYASVIAMSVLVGLIATALLFDFLNGLHDSANSTQPLSRRACCGH